jgi:hypothetical protein
MIMGAFLFEKELVVIMSSSIECNKCGLQNTEQDVEQIGSFTCGESCGCIGYEYALICDCGNVIYENSSWGEFDKEAVWEEIKETFLPTPEKRVSKGQKTFSTLGDSITFMGGYNDWSKPILKDGTENANSFLKSLREKISDDHKPQINILGCSCLTYDCKNCGIGHL